MRHTLNHPLSFAILGGQLFIFHASFFPIWRLYYHHDPDPNLVFFCGTADPRTTLWSVLWNTLIDPPRFQGTVSGDPQDVLMAGFIFWAGAMLGIATYFLGLYVSRKRK